MVAIYSGNTMIYQERGFVLNHPFLWSTILTPSHIIAKCYVVNCFLVLSGLNPSCSTFSLNPPLCWTLVFHLRTTFLCFLHILSYLSIWIWPYQSLKSLFTYLMAIKYGTIAWTPFWTIISLVGVSVTATVEAMSKVYILYTPCVSHLKIMFHLGPIQSP